MPDNLLHDLMEIGALVFIDAPIFQHCGRPFHQPIERPPACELLTGVTRFAATEIVKRSARLRVERTQRRVLAAVLPVWIEDANRGKLAAVATVDVAEGISREGVGGDLAKELPVVGEDRRALQG